MVKIILNAENSTMGRIGSYAAKQALLGNEIAILNSEKAVVSGRKEQVIADYKARRTLNKINPTKGPFFSRSPEKILKRVIRGMLPDFRKGRGKEAWRRIKCYMGIPEEFKKEKMIKIEELTPKRVMSLEEMERKL